jgi:hypothetical protein
MCDIKSFTARRSVGEGQRDIEREREEERTVL